jgi:hypothetical protein
MDFPLIQSGNLMKNKKIFLFSFFCLFLVFVFSFFCGLFIAYFSGFRFILVSLLVFSDFHSVIGNRDYI